MSEKPREAALCKKVVPEMPYKVGIVYPATASKTDMSIVVYGGGTSIRKFSKEDFNRHFQLVDLALTPTMEEQDHNHWKEVMDLAQRYGLIIQAYAGTATLVAHSAQLELLGLSEFIRIQQMNGRELDALDYPFNGKPPEDGENLPRAKK